MSISTALRTAVRNEYKETPEATKQIVLACAEALLLAFREGNRHWQRSERQEFPFRMIQTLVSEADMDWPNLVRDAAMISVLGPVEIFVVEHVERSRERDVTVLRRSLFDTTDGGDVQATLKRLHLSDEMQTFVNSWFNNQTNVFTDQAELPQPSQV